MMTPDDIENHDQSETAYAHGAGAGRRVRCITLETASRTDARRGIRAACSPFGSLSDEIADLALAYLSGDARTGYGADAYTPGGCTVEAGVALLRATRANCPPDLQTALTSAGEWSEVLLGGSRVQLITPTSGTVIELRATGRRWILTIDFGADGSDYRADQIFKRDHAEPALAWQVTPIGTTPEI